MLAASDSVAEQTVGQFDVPAAPTNTSSRMVRLRSADVDTNGIGSNTVEISMSLDLEDCLAW